MARRISRAKKKKLRILFLSVLIVGVAFVAAYYLSLNQIKAQYEAENKELKDQIRSVQYMAYVATADIPAGAAVTDENVSLALISSSMDALFYITGDDIGKIAVVDIRKGEAISTNMIGNDLASTLRECEFAMLTLNSNLKQNDFVDVRIMYPNGENYSVLAKKGVKGINYETNEIYFWLDEENIMNMSAAIVDVYLHPGSILYTTKYIEDGQNAVIVNYQPGSDVMTAMANDPNLVSTATARLNSDMRRALEERLDELNTNNANVSVDLTNAITAGGEDPDATTDATDAVDDTPSSGGIIPGINSGSDASDNGSRPVPDSSNLPSEDGSISGTGTTNPGSIDSSYEDPASGAYEDENNPMNEDGGNTYVY